LALKLIVGGGGELALDDSSCTAGPLSEWPGPPPPPPPPPPHAVWLIIDLRSVRR